MAEFTDKDKETLERLRKAFESKAATTEARQPWQEHLSRETSVPTRSSYAAEIVQGLAGSWASSYRYGFATTFVPDSSDVGSLTFEVPPPVRGRTTKLGLRGVPDIDFVPYNWRTNRFGQKGPSLVGHPISFQVIGPTLKSPFCDWTWQVDPGAGANGGDLLTMDVRPDGGAAVAVNLAEGYNIPNFTMGGLSEPLGGLYVVITDDGANPGSIPAGASPAGALPDRLDTARYEIFRVASVDDDTLELHPNKPLSGHFTTGLPLPKHVRAITILQPYVTRLAAVPGSGEGVGRERSFVVVGPEQAASSDLYPPYDGGTPADGSWLQGGFAGVPTAGAAAQYGGRNVLPDPRPVREGVAVIEKEAAATGALAGQMILQNVQNASLSDLGKVLRVYQIDSDDRVGLTFGTRIQALGWFEVLSTGLIILGDRYVLARVAEVDPRDGDAFFGPGPFLISGADPNHFAYFTVHDPVSFVWRGSFDIDRVEALRLRNLIDPVLVERAAKELSDAVTWPLPGGSSPARADRAIFDTASQVPVGGGLPSAADPGSLLDLGFRMVLFPAREGAGGTPEPDFSQPIVSRDIIIDPAVTEAQSVDIDYSAGIVTLSHAPPSAPGGQIVPNGIIGGPGTDNTRNEVVLFAACVPFSMEPSQTGPGMRVTGGRDGTTDAHSERIGANVDTLNTGFIVTPPFIGATGIVLDRFWRGPPTGVIEILDGRLGPEGTPETRSYGLWGYTEVGGTLTTSTLGLVSSHPDAVDPGGAFALCVILRRDVVFGQMSDGNAEDTDDARIDTLYGSSQRGTSLRFPGARVTQQLDGSVAVVPGLDATGWLWHQWGSLMPSTIPEGASDERLSENGILEEVVYEDDANPTGGPSSGNIDVDPFEGLNLAFKVSNAGGVTRFAGFVLHRRTSPSQGRLTTAQAYRVVFKFGYQVDVGGAHALRYFIGLGPEQDPGGGVSELNQALLDPPDPARNYLGIRITGTVPGGVVISFISQVGGGASVTVPALDPAPNTAAPMYLAIETSRVTPTVRMALYDDQLNLLADTSFSAPVVPTDGLGVTVGTLADGAFAPPVDEFTVLLYGVSVMNRVDLRGPPSIP